MIRSVVSALAMFICIFCTQTLLSSEDPHGYNIIPRDNLKYWIDNDYEVVILDARTKKWDDGQRIPHAISLPHNTDEQLIREKIPSYATPIVVYCTCLECPASRFLAERLVEMGYINIFKYKEGIEDWIEAGYPVYTETK